MIEAVEPDATDVDRALTRQIDKVRFYNRALSCAEVAGPADGTVPLYEPFQGICA